jgi:thioredoxin 1
MWVARACVVTVADVNDIQSLASGILTMLNRRLFFAALGLTGVSGVLATSGAFAGDERPFTEQAFQEAQKAGKPILVEIHASWCPTCKAQKPILSELIVQPKFANMVVFRVDFDEQKDVVRGFGAQMQSTLITFKGGMEVGRSVGDTKRESITLLLDRAI